MILSGNTDTLTCVLAILQISNGYHKTFQIMDYTITNIQNFSLAKMVDFVPYVASRSILLKKLNFVGRLWEVRIFINYNGLENK